MIKEWAPFPCCLCIALLKSAIVSLHQSKNKNCYAYHLLLSFVFFHISIFNTIALAIIIDANCISSCEQRSRIDPHLLLNSWILSSPVNNVPYSSHSYLILYLNQKPFWRNSWMDNLLLIKIWSASLNLQRSPPVTEWPLY